MGRGDMTGTFVVVGGVLLATLVFLLYRWHRRQLEESHARLLARDGLLATSAPCGRGRGDLVRLWACPEGDRSYGIDHGVTGPVDLTVDGGSITGECAAFVWWWEEAHTSTDSEGRTTTSYSRRSRVVGMLRVPYHLPAVTIGPEELLTRWGIGGRRDFQVESDEFNRRFEVHAGERDLAVRLLDAGFWRALRHDGRRLTDGGQVAG